MQSTIAREPQINFKSEQDKDTSTPKLTKRNVDLKNINLDLESSDNGAFLLHKKDTLSEQSDTDDWTRVKDIIANPWFHKILPDMSNMCSVLGNLGSAFAHMMNASSGLKAVADTVASFGTKFFLYVNATIKTLEELSRHNYLVAFGYFLDNLVATFIPQEHTFMARGVSSGIYHAGYSLNMLNQKVKFKDLNDHWNHLKTSSGLLMNKIFDKDVFKNIFSSDNAIPGAVGGLLNILGVAVWPLFGKRTAAWIRDIGGLIKAGGYANPDNVRKGRNLLFVSGLMQVGAAIADFLGSHIGKMRSITVPISLGLDGFSKYIQRQSVNEGELGEV